MLLSITNTRPPATDLSWLLHKHPEKVQAVDLAKGQAHIFYSEATEARCTAHLLLALDTIAMVKDSRMPAGQGHTLQHYVNDRPYVASSFMGTALRKAFGTAMGGTCKDRPELPGQPLPLEAKLSVVAVREGEALIRRLFEPLGYAVEVEGAALDPEYPEWGPSPYFHITLRHTLRLQELLRHLYVLVPVLDGDKHYWVGEQEVEKLLRQGGEWLKAHPEQEVITRRYLKHLHSYTAAALSHLVTDAVDETEAEAKRLRLHDYRLDAVRDEVVALGGGAVADLGCGDGKLLQRLMQQPTVVRLLGLDVSTVELAKAEKRLHVKNLSPNQQQRLQLLQGSLTYRDHRLENHDIAVLAEVIEHVDEARLPTLVQNLFGYARPRHVIMTTPNAEYNALFEQLSAGEFRHTDHRFEWTRPQFENWAEDVASQYGYQVQCKPLGPEAHPQYGTASQMALFSHTPE